MKSLRLNWPKASGDMLKLDDPRDHNLRVGMISTQMHGTVKITRPSPALFIFAL